MPINIANFIVRQPRVPSVNLPTTLPPTSSGTYLLLNAFTIQYTGTGTTARIHVIANYITTIVNNNRTHPDNLNLNITAQTIDQVISQIQAANSNYAISLQGDGAELALLAGMIDQDIKTTPLQLQYGIQTQYLVVAQNTAKFGTALVSWIKDNFSYNNQTSKWELNTGATYNVTDELVPVNGQVPIEFGINLDLTANPAVAWDLANLKTVTNQILVDSAGTDIEFVTMGVLQYIVPGTLQISFNSVLVTEFKDYVVSVPSNRIDFLRNVVGETHVLVAPNLNNVSANTVGLTGILTDYVTVKRNGNLLVFNTDYIVPVASVYEGVNVGNGQIIFTQTFTNDPIAEYVLTTEPALFNNDLVVKLNGVALDPTAYNTVLEAGFINLITPLFPGDILTVSYFSTALGQVNNEILAGTAASVQGTSKGPFNIVSGINDTLLVSGDGNPAETIILPIGTNLKIASIVSSYNSQAVFTVMSIDPTGVYLVISSKTPGPASALTILPSSGNGILGFVPTTKNGSGAVGGDFAFDLAHAPVQITTFNAPQLGNTFFIEGYDISGNYQPGTLIQINSDLYTVAAVSVKNQATVYNTPPASTPGGPQAIYVISTGVNDTFLFSVDGTSYQVVFPTTASPGTSFNDVSVNLTAQQVVNDILLYANPISPGTAALPSSCVSVENINGYDLIKIQSAVVGVGGSVSILPSLEVSGVTVQNTANLMLGFQTTQQDHGLPTTRIEVNGDFVVTYQNPTLLSTHKPVTFLSETNFPVQAPSGTSGIFFKNVDLTGRYLKNTVIKINNSFYFVLKSTFSNNTTMLQLRSNLQDPLYSTQVIEYTNRPVYLQGDTHLFTSSPPVLDKNHTIVLSNNGIPMPLSGYTVNPNGSITLAPAFALSSSSNITAAYTSITNFDAGDVIELSYRIFYNLVEGTHVTASYQYISADEFYLDVIFENQLAQTKIYDSIQTELTNIQNPSSSGFTSSTGGATANDAGGNPTPALNIDQYVYLDSIAHTIFDFYNKRVKNFTDELSYYTGFVSGANSGDVTEQDLQNCVNPSSRLFPLGYTSLYPLAVPALYALNLNDAPITPSNGPQISLTGSASISSTVFYDGTGSNAANNIFTVTVNTPYTVTFTASGAGVTTTLASIVSQINSVINIASASGSNVVLTSQTSLVIGSGVANSVLGFTAGPAGSSADGGLNTTNAIIPLLEAEEADITAENALLATLLTIATGGSVQIQGSADASSVTFYDGTGPSAVNNVLKFTADNTPITITFLASGAGTVTSLSSIVSQIGAHASASGSNVLLTSTVNLSIQDASANGVLGFTNGTGAAVRTGSPEYAQWLALVNDEIAKNNICVASKDSVLANYPQVLQEYVGVYTTAFDQTSVNQTYLTTTFSNELSTTLAKNIVDVAMDINVDSNIQTRMNTTNPARLIEIASEISQITARVNQVTNYFTAENLTNNRYAWVSYRTNRSTGSIQSIQRAINSQSNNAVQVTIDNSLLNALT